MNMPETAASTKKTPASAIASLICGISGLPLSCLFLGIAVAPAAIVLGHIARSKIKKQPAAFTGSGMALAGLILGYVSLSLTLLVAFLAATGGFMSGYQEAVRQSQQNPATRAPVQSEDGGTVRYSNDTLGFSIEVPKNWHDSQITMAHAFAPNYVTIQKSGQGIFEGFASRHDGTLQWLVVMNAGRQKWPIMDACQNYIRGTQIWDKSYRASAPKEVDLRNVDGKCAYFTEEVSVSGSAQKGLHIMVNDENGYFLLLQFRADPRSFDTNWSAWWDIANTLRVFRTLPPLTLEEGKSLQQTDNLQQCLKNLMMIEACKEQLQRDHNLREGAVIPSDLWKRFEGKISLRCPSGGTYTIGKIGEPSSCSIPEHQEWHKAAWNMANQE